MIDELRHLLDPRPAKDGSRRWGWREALMAWLVLFLTGAGVFRFTRVVVGSGNNWPIVWPWYVEPYALLCLGVILVLWVFALSDTRLRLPGWVLTVGMWACLAVLVRYYVRTEPAYAPGSDNADALEVGARALFHLDFPWHHVSKLGGPLSPMLGGFLLAVPIMAIGVTLYAQMLVGLVGGALGLWRLAGSGAAMVALALTGASVMMREAIPRQSDNWIVPLFVVGFGTWGYLLASRPRRTGAWHDRAPDWLLQAVWTGLFACSLAYRFTLWVAVVPLIAVWIRRLGWRSMWRWMAPAGVATLVLVLAPFLVDAKAYLGGPFAMGAAKTGGTGAAILTLLAVVAVTALGTWRVRTLRGAWGVLAAAMAAMVVATGISRMPAEGFAGAFSAYVTIAFNGAIFVPALAALLLPRLGPEGSASTVAIHCGDAAVSSDPGA